MAKKYNYNTPYKDNKGIVNARNKLLAIDSAVPAYKNSYASQLEDIYGRIKNREEFSYNPQNDAAYRQYADQYRALTGLAIADNQAQAQDLTGGYGSTYAPEVAQQGLARLNTGVEAAQPAFYQLAQSAYDVNGDKLNDMYSAAAARRNDELDVYGKRAALYNDRYAFAAQKYNDLREQAYQQYSDNRSYALAKYDTYNQLAANKCADFNEAKNNSGMKAYLNGLVKEDKLTKYMADNLYKQYKYTAPKSGGGGGGGRRRSGGGGGGGSTTPGTITLMGPNGQVITTYESSDGKDYTIKAGTISQISHIGDKGATDNRQTNQSRVDAIKALDLSDEEKLALLKYYGLG